MQTLGESAATKVVFVQSAKYEVQNESQLGILHFVLFTLHFALTWKSSRQSKFSHVRNTEPVPVVCGDAARRRTRNFGSSQPNDSACESDDRPQRTARNPRRLRPNPAVVETDFRAVRVSRSISFNGRVSGRGPEPSLLLGRVRFLCGRVSPKPASRCQRQSITRPANFSKASS